MKVELRAIKYARWASEETSCFNATVVLDDRPAGTVRNDGHGGCNFYDPHGLQQRLEEYARTLPPIPADPKRGYHELPMNADLLIGEILGKELSRKDLKRLLGKRVVTLGADGKIYQSARVLSREQLAAALACPHVGTVLNLLPEEEALRLFLAAS